MKELFKYINTIIHLAVRGARIFLHVFIYIPCHPHIYKSLRQFKNIHKGERCFIVATGPSLTLEDVNKLKSEICFGLNSVFRLFDKTDWRPTYYALFDGGVYEKIKDGLNNAPIKCGFCADNIEWYPEGIHRVGMWGGWRGNTKEEMKLFPDSLQERQLRISSDISKYVYSGSSVVHMILQICFYMGFSEIYLIGTDCDFGGAETHSKIVQYKSIVSESPEYLYYTLMRDYKRAKKYADKNSIKIYNATRGGKLEVFERVNLDEVVKTNHN